MKSGLDYFPLEVVDDLKLRLFKAELGAKGFGLLIELWRYIYREDGYFGRWNDDVRSLFSFEQNVSGDLVSEVVNAAVRRDIFDQGMFEKYGILTSRGIQKRYLEGVSRRSSVTLEKSYLLIDVPAKMENVNISGENVNKNGENVYISEQSKVKESKVKKSKVNECISGSEMPPEPTPEKRTRFVPPTLDEVAAYCKERGNAVDPQKWFDHYSANGWKVGRSPMKDWKASVRTWERNEFSEKKKEAPATSSFETDEFFDAALKKSYKDTEKLVADLKNKYGGQNEN